MNPVMVGGIIIIVVLVIVIAYNLFKNK